MESLVVCLWPYENDVNDGFKSFDSSIYQRIIPPGHGASLSYPDRPSLVWEYRNGLGENVKRNNPDEFIGAVEKMCHAMYCFRKSDLDMDLESAPGLPAKDRKKILSLIKSVKGDSGEDRHKRWIEEIGKGNFSFGSEEIGYIAKGKGSWKHKSIGQLLASDTGREEFTFKKTFLSSNWKLFHDALQAHRFDVLHDVLPKYGLCAA